MIYALMNFVDMFMVGKEIVTLGLGTVAVAGLGFANQMFMIFMTSLFGMNSGGGILAAQYFGNKDYKKSEEMSWDNYNCWIFIFAAISFRRIVYAKTCNFSIHK